jgi:CubicO group peptidase (beta-lactamase class C family)
MKWSLLPIACCLFATAPLAAQAPAPLALGRTLEDTLDHGDTSRYTVALRARQFVYGEVIQHTVDAVVTIFAPDGRRVGRFDVTARGPEAFLIRAADAGTYRIEVTPFAQETGRYGIALRRIERLAGTPAGRVDQVMAQYLGADRPGGVVAVTRGGATVFARGYGMANLEDGLANTPATVYHVASVSKQFTAFAIAMLAVQGRLSLDDDVRRYLPEVPDFGRTITLRHLLTHTSGLRDQWELWGMSGGLLGDVIRQQDLLRLVQRQRELNFEPGAEHLYCNTGFMLLSEVVARVTGEPFREWMRTNVFAPLGMSATQIYDDDERLVPGRAYSFQEGEDGVRKSVLSYANAGATSLFTTANDLARWLRNWHTAEVGGPRVLALMQERGVLNRGDTLPYALGLGVDTWRGQRRLFHGGADAGYRTFLEYFPALDAGVIVLGNSASFNSGGVADQVAEAFFGGALAPATPAPAPQAAAPAAREPWRPGAAALAAFAGRYLSDELETIYTMAVVDGKLVARHRRHGDIPLTPAEPDAFDGGQWFFGRVRFERDAAGGVTAFRVSSGRARNVLFRRMP